MNGLPSFSGCSKFIKCIIILLLFVLLTASLAACSEDVSSTDLTPSPSPSETATPAPSETAAPMPEPTPTPEPEPTPTPEPDVSFPPLTTDSSGAYTFPQVVSDKTECKTGEFVYFRIVTSNKVKKIQTVIDGVNGKTYSEFTTESDFRIWTARISFTVGGNRKVQFRCSTTSGGTVLIPDSPVRISVTFKYTADSTSKIISSGKTVIFTLKTPSSVDNVYALVDGVKQNVKETEPYSDKDGIKIWKINITFFKLGTRSVTFDACAGTKVKATFPDPGIPIIVE